MYMAMWEAKRRLLHHGPAMTLSSQALRPANGPCEPCLIGRNDALGAQFTSSAAWRMHCTRSSCAFWESAMV